MVIYKSGMKKTALFSIASLLALFFSLSCARSPSLEEGELTAPPSQIGQGAPPSAEPAPAEPAPAEPAPAEPAPAEPAPAEPAPATPTTIRISIDSSGNQANGASGDLFGPAISADGRFIAFSSLASNLVTGDTNAARDIFLRDMLNQTTKRISLDSSGTQGNNGSFRPSISADGRFVVFSSLSSNLVSDDTNGCSDIFLRNTLNQTTTRLSIGVNGTQSNCGSNIGGGSIGPAISADGRVVAFSSLATNLDSSDTNGASDIFVHDISAKTTRRVSLTSNGGQGNNASFSPALSSDGRFITFGSFASNLISSDTNNFSDIFLHDTTTQATVRVSLSSSGIQGNGHSANHPSKISANGQFVVFSSVASNLVPGDTNGHADVFYHDTLNRTTVRVSVNSAGNEGNNLSTLADISADGRFIAFQSVATNLVNDTNTVNDIFLHDTVDRTTILISVGLTGNVGFNESQLPVVSADGSLVAFSSFASNLVSSDTNGTFDVFLRRLK